MKRAGDDFTPARHIEYGFLGFIILLTSPISASSRQFLTASLALSAKQTVIVTFGAKLYVTAVDGTGQDALAAITRRALRALYHTPQRMIGVRRHSSSNYATPLDVDKPSRVIVTTPRRRATILFIDAEQALPPDTTGRHHANHAERARQARAGPHASESTQVVEAASRPASGFGSGLSMMIRSHRRCAMAIIRPEISMLSARRDAEHDAPAGHLPPRAA